MRKIPKVALFLETTAVNDRRVFRGIIKYSQHFGPWVFYAKVHPFYMMRGRNLWRKKILPELKKWRPDGIIAHVDNQKAGDLLEFGVPTILSPLLEPHCPGDYSYESDGAAIGQVGAEHLLERGFKNIAFCGYNGIYWSDGLCRCFIERVAKAGFQTYVYESPASAQITFLSEDASHVGKWLASLPKPVAVMACNDVRGRQVIDACNLLQLTVPDVIAVLGVDDDDLICDSTYPPLSSVSLSTEKTGYEVAELLDKMMHRGQRIAPQKIIINPTHVVARQSTDILAVEDTEVAKAVRFIRTNMGSVRRVDEVVGATSLQRRYLERRFRKALKKSIYEEIRWVQMEWVAKMLLETTMPIYQIASVLGYASGKHLDRPFRKEKGISPAQYRKTYGGK
jgi:LacI family transcriptional regulator